MISGAQAHCRTFSTVSTSMSRHCNDIRAITHGVAGVSQRSRPAAALVSGRICGRVVVPSRARGMPSSCASPNGNGVNYNGYTNGSMLSTNGYPGRVDWLHGSSDAVASDYDAIIVLGGGLMEDGGLPAHVMRRLDAAADIKRMQGSQPCPILCLGNGTPHKPPPRSPWGFSVHEATVCADYLLSKGVGPEEILKEEASFDTVGNGYFSLTMHVIPAGWRRCCVITSRFHMPRTRAIFQLCYRLGAASAVGNAAAFELDFHAVVDDGVFPADVLRSRLYREQDSLQAWVKNTRELRNLRDLHAWLFATHSCYSVSKQEDFGRPSLSNRDLDAKALASY